MSICYAVGRIKSCVPKKTLYMIYHAHFLSHIAYLNPIWSECAEYKLQMIQRLQNKIIKHIENKPRLTRSSTLYENIPNIVQYSNIQKAILLHKIQNKQIKTNIQLNKIGNTQNIVLRSFQNFRTKFFKLEKCKKSILSNGLYLYNKIPTQIRNTVNPIHFKKNIVNYIMKM